MAAASKQTSEGRPFLPFLWINELFIFIGECTLLLVDAIRRAIVKRFEWGETLQQMAFVGVASVPIVALTSFASGAVISLYTAQLLVEYGAGGLAGGAVGLAVTREIAPVLAGIMVAARCGSAMAAQIGTMAVSEQLDALRSLNVHPTSYLVVPRLVAGLTMLPVLALVGMYSGVIGGFLVAVPVAGVPSGQFWNSLEQFAEPRDFLLGMAKTVVFGGIVALVACQQGLRTKGGAVGVGNATTRTVVLTMVLIYLSNYVLTALFFA